jgi:xylose isomerase
MLDVTLKLGGENFAFWGGREGYASLLNSDIKRELDHLAAFFKMAIAYGDKIGFKGVYLIEPKAKEPTSHQYDYDAQTVISFLKTYGLDDRMRLNIEPNHGQLAGHRMPHDVHFAAKLGFLGSVDCNTGSEDLGWDTDEFIMEIHNATQIMLAVLQMGGLAPGGMNFDCKVRRESVDIADLFWGHVSAMDCLAIGLLNAAKIIEDGVIPGMIKDRYSGWDSGFGAKIEQGAVSIEDCEKYILDNGEPAMKSGQEEKYKAILNEYLIAKL